MQHEAPTINLESAAWRRGCHYVAGVDEVGRGAWAGPVVAAAVVLPPVPEIASVLSDVRDSKALSAHQREELATLISAHATTVTIGMAPPQYVDSAGLLPATARAMNEALTALGATPDHVLVDGTPMRGLSYVHTAVVKGDAHCLSIAAASIIAKVTRDRLMTELDDLHPGYLFGRHKGYGTAIHRTALYCLGPSPVHRFSYAPITAIMAQSWV